MRNAIDIKPRKVLLPLVGALSILGCTAAKQTNVFRRRYPTGQTKVEMEMKSGVPNGRGMTYHQNGEVESQGPYKAAARHGMFHYWSEQGVWLKQELYRSGRLSWTSTNRSDFPPDERLAHAMPPALDAGRASISPATTDMPATSVATSPASTESFLARPTPRFLSGLPGHGSFVQLSMGSGSAVENSSATRMGFLASHADGQLGASVALNVSRFESALVSRWGKPVVELQTSYLLPYTTGVFVARAGVVLPLGNDSNQSALAGAAGVVQAPNEAIYVLCFALYAGHTRLAILVWYLKVRNRAD